MTGETPKEVLVGRPAAAAKWRRKRGTRKRRQTRRVAERVAAAARLVEERGCVATSALIHKLDVTYSEARYVFRLLQLQRRVVEVVVADKIAIWCRDAEAAEGLMSRLKEAVRRLAANVVYATPSKVLKMALRDRDAYELLRTYIPLSRSGRPHPVALAVIKCLLDLTYGEPIKYSNKYVYVVSSGGSVERGCQECCRVGAV